MEIKLNDKKTFIVKYENAKFTFRNDSRSLFNLISGGFERDSIIENAKKDLIKIEGIRTKERDVTVSDFESLPIEVYIEVVNGYATQIKKSIESLEFDTKKKKKPKK